MARKSRKKSTKTAKTFSASKKKLYRSSRNRVLLGVLGGLAEYFNADPLHVRIAWAAFIILVGLAVGAVAYSFVPTVLTLLAVVYVIAYFLMTETPAK